MKKPHLTHIIKEEIGNIKKQLLINELKVYNDKVNLHENLIDSILQLFLEPKVRKKAEAIKNSPEYKELHQQIKISSESINQLTKQLKRKINDYESLISDLQKSGIPAKMGDSIDKIYKKTKSKHKDILQKYNIF